MSHSRLDSGIQRSVASATAAFALALLAFSCTAALRRPPSDGPKSLVLAGDVVMPQLPSPGAFHGARFGGISSLAFDPATGDLLGLSDDSHDPRVFVFRASRDDEPINVEVKGYFPLPLGEPGAPAGMDPEGLALTRTGRVFVSSEGLSDRSPRVPPGIYEFSRHVGFIRALDVPRRFIPPPSGPLTTGVRSNASFESLTITPDDRWLFTATESAIVQDGAAADFNRGAPSRIVEYEASGGTYVPRREFAYYVDPVARPDFTARFSINGLVELLAYDNANLLSMERSYAEESADGRRLNRIRIYRVSLGNATDVSGIESLAGARGFRAAEKQLVLDFADLRGLSADIRELDNFEGLTFGPHGPAGDTLIAVSDDNFNRQQHTAFLRLRQGR